MSSVGEAVIDARKAAEPNGEMGAADDFVLRNAVEAESANFEQELIEEVVIPSRAQGRCGYRFVKRLFDIVFSIFVVAVCLIPGLILCMIIVIDSPGAPIYTQRRVGQFGKPIRILKFRTMYKDADISPEKYLNETQLKEWHHEYKVGNDPRITKIGRWLRSTSLDELPQFLNVLFTSKMSVIGVRPVVDSELSAYGNDVDKFLSVKPGITGWWQVEARNDANYEDGGRQQLELYYAEHQSAALDGKIFFMTFSAIFRKTGN